MKRKRKTGFLSSALILMILCSLIAGGCGQAAPSSQDSTEPAGAEEGSTEADASGDASSGNAEISERAMENFLGKIQAGGYVMDSAGFMKASVCSPDLVWFDYAEDDLYRDFAVMSVGGEVFQGFFTEDGMEDVSYMDEGTALDLSEKMLPSYWLEDEVSGGNIYNVFYNDTENPLTFVSYDDGVKNQVRSLAGYGEMALKYMHEVYLTMDAEDPASARLQAVVDDDEVARYYFDDIDITITFGEAQADARAEAWMKEPVYPEGRSGWTEGDIFIFNSIFLPGYGDQAIPYMPFASYALKVDEENFLSDDAVYIRDPHASEDDVKAYIDILKQNGFEEHAEGDETTYRRLLREETRCWSSISLAYEDGLNLTARKAYDFPEYKDLEEINAALADLGIAPLPETEALTGFTAVDRKWEQTESWLYFYDYNAVLYVTASYSGEDQAMQYLKAYAEDLKAQGYAPHDDSEGEDNVDYYQSPDESANFRWHFEEDGETVILLYKAEKRLDASETQAILSKAGFPEIDFTSFVSGRDTGRFEKTMYGRDYAPSVSLSWRFDTAEEAESFLDTYVGLLEEDDFLRVPASDLGSSKQNGYTNEAKGLGVAFDFLPAEDNTETFIYFDFRGGIDFAVQEEGGPLVGWKYSEEEGAGTDDFPGQE